MHRMMIGLWSVIVFVITVYAEQQLCDLSVDNGICLFGGQKILVPPAHRTSLLGSWTFDDRYATDSSGNGNHAVELDDAKDREGPSFQSGPGVSHSGRSLKVSGSNYLKIPFSAQLSEWSVTFWLNVLSDSTSSEYCPLVFYGRSAGDLTMKVSLNSKKHMLGVTSAAEAENSKKMDIVNSEARLQPHSWYHIAAIRSHDELTLYVNGILDSKASTSGQTYTSAGDIYLGNLPWEECTSSVLIDELKFHKEALDESYVQAASFPSLGSVSPRFAMLGCRECDAAAAEGSCSTNYHVCSELELQSGGYAVGRKMGWVALTSSPWTEERLEAAREDGGDKTKHNTALCCSDYQ